MTVQEVFNQVLPRLQGPALCTIFEALREVQGIIAGRLLLKRSELLVQDPEAELYFAAGEQRAELPEDFRALFERPYVSAGAALKPLPGPASAQASLAAGPPKYYQVIGRVLRIFPVTDAAYTVLVPYYGTPPIPESLADELPYYGEFDDVLVEGCVAVLTGGLTVVADRAFVGLIQSQVDALLAAKDMVAEQLMADTINGL
jgi:hypothetical protein